MLISPTIHGIIGPVVALAYNICFYGPCLWTVYTSQPGMLHGSPELFTGSRLLALMS